MARREFTKPVRVEIVKRATVAGVVRCEECGCAPRVWHVDHTNPDGLQVDKSKPLTAADGKVLCAGSPESCHGKKTPQDVKVIAKAKRNEAKHLRAALPSAGGLPGRSRETKEAARRARMAPGKLPVPGPRVPPGYATATESQGPRP